MENFNDIRDWLNADFCEGGGIEEDRIQELYDYARLLDKALDKACEELEGMLDVDDYYASCNLCVHKKEEKKVGCSLLGYKCPSTKEEIKEYLLKESEKQ